MLHRILCSPLWTGSSFRSPRHVLRSLSAKIAHQESPDGPPSGSKLSPDEIRKAVADFHRLKKVTFRLNQIPAPPNPITDPGSVVESIRHDEQSAIWSSVKDIKLPYKLMHDLLSQKESGRVLRNTFSPKRTSESKAKSIHRQPKGRSAFHVWLSENKKEIRDKLPVLNDGVMAMQQILKAAHRAWKLLPEEEKSPYRQKADEMRNQVQAEKSQ